MKLKSNWSHIVAGISGALTLALCSMASAETYWASTLAGTGKFGAAGDGGPAAAAELANPAGVSVAPDGTVYIADYRGRRIRKVAPDGVISTFAGSGPLAAEGDRGAPPPAGAMGDGGPASKAELAGPYGVRAGPDGRIYIADQRAHRVRVVGKDGIISTFAGTGARGFGGDGGPAAAAQLAGPNDVRFDSKGNAYIADTGNNRVRRVASDGTISTFAGAGEEGFAGDGGPAAQARMRGPCALFVDAKDQLYICDIGNHAVWKVDAAGAISVIAGTGKMGFNSDGKPGRETQLREPCGAAVDAAGQVFIADSRSNRIRVIRASGVVETIAGVGAPGYRGDGGPALEAAIRIPDLIDIDAKGNLYLAEFRNNVIRKLERGD